MVQTANRISSKTEFADSGTLGRMLGLELLEYDGSEYRLDDRIERFIEDMLR